MRCVNCEKDSHLQATYYLEAAHSMKKVNNTEFLELADKAIHCYSMGGRRSSAAQLAKECAEKLEEDYDFEQATVYYEKAA